MEQTIFTRIIKGEIPSHKVFEDEKTYAFMDIYPIQPGMVLVIPKEQIANIEDLSDDTYMAVMTTSHKIAKALRKTFPNKLKIALQVEGLDVQHVHVKLFPFDTAQEFHAHAPTTDPDHDELEETAEKLRRNI
jgi:histidine triad (HIT) family protein